MQRNPLQWITQNLGTLVLSFILAVVVWISASIAADPNVERVYPRQIALDVEGKDTSLMLAAEIPEQVRLTLYAPESVWTDITNREAIDAWVDLSGLGPGEHVVPVQIQIAENAGPVRIVQKEPAEVQVELERLTSVELPVGLRLVGDPPLGYERGEPTVSPETVIVSGPNSQVSQVSAVEARLDISTARDDVDRTINLEPLDINGDTVPGVTLTPKIAQVTLPVTLQEAFKTLAVRPVTQGQPADGYRLTTIQPSPVLVIVYSGAPQLINQLPGFVQTRPIDIDGLTDDIEVRVELDLPSGVSLVGEQSVLVQVGIGAIESSMTIAVPVEALGLPPEYQVQLSPDSVDLIVEGPLPVLESLTQASFRAIVDLTGLEPGSYQRQPVMDLVPAEVRVQSLLPETIEVEITIIPTPTPTLPPSPTVLAPPTATVQPPATAQPAAGP
jgi:YbbR domain-containing protein